MRYNNDKQVCLRKESQIDLSGLVQTLGEDAFTFDWAGELNWFVSPVCLLGKIAKHFHSSKSIHTGHQPHFRR